MDAIPMAIRRGGNLSPPSSGGGGHFAGGGDFFGEGADFSPSTGGAPIFIFSYPRQNPPTGKVRPVFVKILENFFGGGGGRRVLISPSADGVGGLLAIMGGDYQ